jgi:hypothetical protein
MLLTAAADPGNAAQVNTLPAQLREHVFQGGRPQARIGMANEGVGVGQKAVRAVVLR